MDTSLFQWTPGKKQSSRRTTAAVLPRGFSLMKKAKGMKPPLPNFFFHFSPLLCGYTSSSLSTLPSYLHLCVSDESEEQFCDFLRHCSKHKQVLKHQHLKRNKHETVDFSSSKDGKLHVHKSPNPPPPTLHPLSTHTLTHRVGNEFWNEIRNEIWE